MKRKVWVVLLVLVVAALLLSGCGVPREGVDVMTTEPNGLWQSLVVWPLSKALIWLDGFFLGMGLPHHWGFAIIAFTLIIKLITFPLTLSQLRGMQAQKELQPKIQEMQKKYGKDREKLAQAQMKLYQEAGVNPLSGCLPLIVQMPVLFGLYSALVALGPTLKDASFFWIPDLGFPSFTQGMSWIPEFFRAGEYGMLAAYLVLPVLLVASQYSMQKWMTPTTGVGDQAGMMKQVGLMMTFMFGFFTLQVPAGLTLYWVTSNGLQMLQQWFVTSDRFSMVPNGSITAKLNSISVDSESTPGSNGASPEEADTSKDQQTDTEQSQRPRRRKAKKRR